MIKMTPSLNRWQIHSAPVGIWNYDEGLHWRAFISQRPVLIWWDNVIKASFSKLNENTRSLGNTFLTPDCLNVFNTTPGQQNQMQPNSCGFGKERILTQICHVAYSKIIQIQGHAILLKFQGFFEFRFLNITLSSSQRFKQRSCELQERRLTKDLLF